MKRLVNSRLAAGAVGAALATTAFVTADQLNSHHEDDLTVRYADASYAFDVSDERQLAGAADNIFVGRVLGKTGTKKLDELPETQYRVRVLDNLKGGLDREVTVNQQGGYDGSTKELVMLDGDMLLQPGKTYVFTTLANQEQGWHTLVPVHGDEDVSSLTPAELDKVKDKKREAIERQVKPSF